VGSIGQSSKPDRFLLTTVVALIPILLTQLFLSGWAYNRTYYGRFGIDQRLFDFGLYDQIAKGFAITIAHRFLLVTFLASALLLIVAFHYESNKWKLEVPRIILLVSLILFAAYIEYECPSSLGNSAARTDLSDDSTLPSLTFEFEKGHFRGQLLAMKGDLVFVARQDAFTGKTDLLTVYVYRIEELQHLQVIGRP
jgi:hypothetical protein